MPVDSLKIMGSSTVYGSESDLDQIHAILKGYGYDVVMSKNGTVYVPIGVSNEKACLQAVEDCDLFLGIIFPRYGSGITHKKVSKAIELDKPRWFISDHFIEHTRQLIKQFMFDEDGSRNEFEIHRKSLLKQGEGEQLELKQVVRKDSIGKSICAFLNHEGGQVLIGVSDDNKVVGITDAERWEKELTDYLNTAIIPEAPVMVSLEQVGSKQVILVKVWAGSKQPYIFDGSIYFRSRGQSTVKATSQEISDLIHNRQKTELHWERQMALGVELGDLDIHEIQKTITRSINESKLDESNGNPIDFLTHFGLFQNGHFTNAAVVLFAKNPARFIPQARVRVAFLEKGKTADEFVDDKLLDGNLFKNSTAVQDFFEKHLRTSRKFSEKEWERQDEYVVPMSALREGVMNALAHRDYSVPSASMSVIIYSDKIEIFNSGKSPLKSAELRKSHLSLPVNPDIAHMAFLRGYIKKIGKGTIKIMDACKAAGLKAPNWTTSETSVKLSFPLNVKLGGATDGTDDGAKDDELFFKLDGAIDGATKATKRKLSVLLKAIVSNEGKRTPDYKKITKLGMERTMERHIEQLKEVGFIEFKGTAAQTGGYFITEKNYQLMNQKFDSLRLHHK